MPAIQQICRMFQQFEAVRVQVVSGGPRNHFPLEFALVEVMIEGETQGTLGQA